MDKLKGCFSTGQVQPLNFGSGYFLSSNVGQYKDFNITNLDLDVIQDIYVVMNATNTSTTAATIPLLCTHWIQQYSIYQGQNQWENNVPNNVILLKTLLNNDDTKLESLVSLELFDASTGQHDSSSIASLAMANYYVKMPPCTLTNSFVFLPSLSQPPRLQESYQLFSTQQSTLIAVVFHVMVRTIWLILASLSLLPWLWQTIMSRCLHVL